MTRRNATRQPIFCKKHYEAIAIILRTVAGNPELPPYAVGAVIRSFANAFAAENPRFDKSMFFKACNPVLR